MPRKTRRQKIHASTHHTPIVQVSSVETPTSAQETTSTRVSYKVNLSGTQASTTKAEEQVSLRGDIVKIVVFFLIAILLVVGLHFFMRTYPSYFSQIPYLNQVKF